MSDVVKVYIGTDPSQLGAAEVLRQSILETSSEPVEVHTMEKVHIPQPKDVRQSQRTGFSFARWAIPELCGHKGRAIYVDADMFVFTDIKELWETPMDGATVAIVDGRDTSYCSDKAKGNKNETSVMVIDCEKADWTLQQLVDGLSVQYNYYDMMNELCFIPEENIRRNVPRRWNSMDYWDETVSLIHFTNVPTQPWVSTENPFGYVWVNLLKRMIDEGKVQRSFINEQVENGYFRPSLLVELDGRTNMDDDPDYSAQLKALDSAKGYIAHSSLLEYAKKRDKAIRSYELDQARHEDFGKYVKMAANYVVDDLKGIARKVLKRA